METACKKLRRERRHWKKETLQQLSDGAFKHAAGDCGKKLRVMLKHTIIKYDSDSSDASLEEVTSKAKTVIYYQTHTSKQIPARVLAELAIHAVPVGPEREQPAERLTAELEEMRASNPDGEIDMRQPRHPNGRPRSPKPEEKAGERVEGERAKGEGKDGKEGKGERTRDQDRIDATKWQKTVGENGSQKERDRDGKNQDEKNRKTGTPLES